MSPAEGEGALALSPEQLQAVAELWRGQPGRELRVRFTGASMAPTITSGAEVRLLCGEGADVGEVVAVREGAAVIVHRVVARSRDGRWLLTRGDARTLPDPPVPAERVLGRVLGPDAAAALASAPHAPLRAVLLWPLIALLHASPPAASALLAGLVRARRFALRMGPAVRARLSRRAPR